MEKEMKLAKIKKLIKDMGDDKVMRSIEMINLTLDDGKEVTKKAGDKIAQAIELDCDIEGEGGVGGNGGRRLDKILDHRLLLLDAERYLSKMLLSVTATLLELKDVVGVVREIGWDIREIKESGGGDVGQEGGGDDENFELFISVIHLRQNLEQNLGFLGTLRQVLEFEQELGQAEMEKEEKDKK